MKAQKYILPIHVYDMDNNLEKKNPFTLHCKTGILVVLLAFIFTEDFHGTEFPITTHESVQCYPVIYGDIVVWEDFRNGFPDIYALNLLTSQEFPVTTNSSEQWGPTLYEEYIVWTDFRNSTDDIYCYNLLTQQEFQITLQTWN